MSTEAAFLEAALPPSSRILGQHLRPFSVGHHLILSRHGSPFVSTGADTSIASYRFHLPFAVFVCSHSYADAMEQIESPDFNERVWIPWHNRICRKQVFGLFFRTLKAIPDDMLVEKSKAFLEYVKQGDMAPHVTRESTGGKGKKCGAPYMLSLINTLTNNGWTASEAFNCPLGLANWIYSAVWERDGSLQITGTDAEEELNAIREYAAANGLKLRKWRNN